MSATIVDQLIDSPFQDLLFEAEPQDLPDLFLLLIQDSTLWKRRIRSLRRQLVDQTLQPPDQITGLQPVLDAIGECRLWDALRETEITAEQVCEVADLRLPQRVPQPTFANGVQHWLQSCDLIRRL